MLGIFGGAVGDAWPEMSSPKQAGVSKAVVKGCERVSKAVKVVRGHGPSWLPFTKLTPSDNL